MITANYIYRPRPTATGDRLVGLVVRRPPRERKIPGSNPACDGIFSGSSHNFLVPVVTILNSTTKSCKDWLNFILKFDLLKVFLWLTKDEKQTPTYFTMCLSKAAHVLQLKPTQLVWCGVV